MNSKIDDEKNASSCFGFCLLRKKKQASSFNAKKPYKNVGTQKRKWKTLFLVLAPFWNQTSTMSLGVNIVNVIN